MANEIERKFLVNASEYIKSAKIENSITINQFYLVNSADLVLRVRSYNNNMYFLAVKSSTDDMMIRVENETKISAQEFDHYLRMNTGKVLIKTRDTVIVNGFEWSVDTITNNSTLPLIISEIEFETEDDANNYDLKMLPCWVLDEVTDDPMYTNSNLVNNKNV